MRSYKKKLILFFMTVILISPILSPSIVGAITESTQSSETATTTESTMEQSASTTSTEQTNASEAQETENSVEETTEETNYEERELSDEALEPSPHPVVQLEEENKGSLLVQNENGQEVTRLNKLILQTKQDEGEWQDKQEYEVEDNYSLTEVPYSFEYGADPFQRIIVEYSVEEYQDGRLIKRTRHMAHYMLEESEKQEEISSSESEDLEEINEGDASSEESVDSNHEEERVAQSPIETKEENNSNVKENLVEIPTINKSEDINDSNHGLQRIGPLASDVDVTKEGTDNNGIKYKEYLGGYTPNSTSGEAGVQAKVVIKPITKTSAKIEGVHYRTGEVRSTDNRPIYVLWSTNPKTYGSAIDAADMDGIGSKKAVTFTTNGQNRKMTINTTIDNLLAGKTYYFWIYVTTTYNSSTYNTIEMGRSDSTVIGSAEYRRYNFTTDSTQPLSIDSPKFDENTTTSVRLVTSEYTGDISQTTNDGILRMSSDTSNNFSNKFTNIVHETKRGLANSKGKVNTTARSITGLKPGTKYRAQLAIKDFGSSGTDGALRYSSEVSVSTKNGVEGLALTANNRPTSATGKASAEFSARYTYNSNSALAAHPKTTINDALHVRAKLSSTTNWGEDLTGTTTIRVEKVQCSSGIVKFKLTNLEPNKTYNVAFRVTNDGGDSGYAFLNGKTDGSFTTFATPITIPNSPVVEVSSSTSAKLNKGSYASGSKQADLIVERYTGTGTNWTGVANNSYLNIPKSNTEYAVTNGFTFDGLTPGNRYRSRVKLHYNDTSGQSVTSGLSNEYITPNTVSAPTVSPVADPPTYTTASATVVGEYQAGTQHPKGSGVSVGIGGKGVQIELKPASDSNYVSAEGKVSDLIINTSGSSPNVSFKLTNLKSATFYDVRFRVQNGSGIWSNWGEANFSTRGVKPELDHPIFEQATPTTVKMRGGSYRGDLTTTLNRGIIQTESYNVSGGPTDSVSKVTNLAHNPSAKTYEGRTITGLNPGTRYRGWFGFMDYGTTGEGNYCWQERFDENNQRVYFYTTNRISNLSEPTQEVPTAINDANATFTATYEAAGQHETQVAAHPTKVRVFLGTDISNLNEITTNSTGPRLVRDNDIRTGSTEVNFKIEGLRAGTRYYVQYQVINQGGESPKSGVYDFVTLSRPDGLYINEVPEAFNFGTVELSENSMSHPLQNVGGGDNHVSVDFENINMNSQWTLSAKLSELQVSGGQQTLTGSKIVMDKELKKTSDGGSTWDTPDSAKFDTGLGIQGSEISLPADGETSVPLFKATDIPYGIGHFENRIAKNSVRLFVPGNTGERGKTYSGSITWTMDNLA